MVVQQYAYDSFGVPYVKSGTGVNTVYVLVSSYTGSLHENSRLYTSREYDREVSLYFNRARYYSPSTGKFISRDPIGQNDQINLYTYVGNSPMMYVDLMGREKILILIALDYDGKIPKFDANNKIIDPTPAIGTLYNNLKERLDKEGKKYDYKVISSFEEFDFKINEKKREEIYVLGHGFSNSIDLDASKPTNGKAEITSRSLKNDKQTPEEERNLSNTHLTLYSCSTGDGLPLSPPIAQKIQDHYNFESTSAPNTLMYSNFNMYDNRGILFTKRKGKMVEFY